MFGKLKAKRLEDQEMGSGKKPINLFSRIIESRELSNTKKSAFLDETKVSANESTLTSNNGSIINSNNKENKKPKGLQFKGFPHKKLVKVTSDGPLTFNKTPKTPKSKLICDGPVIGSSKKKGLISGPSTDRNPYGFNLDSNSKGYNHLQQEKPKNEASSF